MIRVAAKLLSLGALLARMLTVTTRKTPVPMADLPPHLLRDIGVTRQDYRGATGRMSWDAPDHWFDDPARR